MFTDTSRRPDDIEYVHRTPATVGGLVAGNVASPAARDAPNGYGPRITSSIQRSTSTGSLQDLAPFSSESDGRTRVERTVPIGSNEDEVRAAIGSAPQEPEQPIELTEQVIEIVDSRPPDDSIPWSVDADAERLATSNAVIDANHDRALTRSEVVNGLESLVLTASEWSVRMRRWGNGTAEQPYAYGADVKAFIDTNDPTGATRDAELLAMSAEAAERDRWLRSADPITRIVFGTVPGPAEMKDPQFAKIMRGIREVEGQARDLAQLMDPRFRSFITHTGRVVDKPALLPEPGDAFWTIHTITILAPTFMEMSMFEEGINYKVLAETAESEGVGLAKSVASDAELANAPKPQSVEDFIPEARRRTAAAKAAHPSGLVGMRTRKRSGRSPRESRPNSCREAEDCVSCSQNVGIRLTLREGLRMDSSIGSVTEWVRGPSRTPGEPFEWDVQVSPLGRAKVGWLSRDPDMAHINVSLYRRVTH